jgi:large subunit ribosomal protein L18
MVAINTTAGRRKARVRKSLRSAQAKSGRPRLSVHRTSQHIYAQVIDDRERRTVASASSRDKGLGLSKGSDVAAAEAVGKAIAEAAKKAGVSAVIFDRGGYIYHGRIKALADGAREGGLEF